MLPKTRQEAAVGLIWPKMNICPRFVTSKLALDEAITNAVVPAGEAKSGAGASLA
jgi:hypothetical protein